MRSERTISPREPTREFEQVADKLTTLIEAKHIVLFARIDFAADAQRAGLAMQPSQLLVFGNPPIARKSSSPRKS